MTNDLIITWVKQNLTEDQILRAQRAKYPESVTQHRKRSKQKKASQNIQN